MSKESLYDERPLKVQEETRLALRQSAPAIVIIGIGVLLLATNIFHFELINILWPGFIIAPGLMLLWPTHASSPDQQSRLSFLAVPGAMIVTTGVMLFVMNVTDHFEAWAYSWTLLLASIPAALMYIKRFEPTNSIHESGHRFIRTMIMMFMGLAVLFEVVIFQNFSPLLPLLLIGYGLVMFVKNRREMRVA